MREPEVLGIAFKCFGRRKAAALVSGRADDQLDQVFGVPAAFAKLDGQPIEQLGMGRVLALDAEVIEHRR